MSKAARTRSGQRRLPTASTLWMILSILVSIAVRGLFMIADLMDFDTKIAEDAVKRCAVVGGGGYVGWQLSQRLRNDGFQVWILDIGLLPEPLQFLDSDANHHADLAPIQFCEVRRVFLECTRGKEPLAVV